MQLFTKHVAVSTLALGMALAATGCDTARDDKRPDMDTIRRDENGLQSRDLREMCTMMAPKMLACNDVVRNPFRIVVVMKNMENDTEDMPGRPLDIYLVKLTSLLNEAAASDRVQFVENYAKLQAMRASEGLSANPFEDAGRAPTADARLVPQYYLSGELHSMKNGRSTYYLFTFHLTNFQTGAQVWNGSYDVKTLD